MKKILVPTDFSPNAETALYFSMRLAKQGAYDLVVLNVIESLMTERDASVVTAEEQQQLEAEVTMQTLALSDLCRQIEAAGDINYTSLVETGADAADCISRVAENKKVDLIIIGAKGKSGADDFVFGTTTTSLIEQISRPVLVIPEQIRLDKKIKKISYATALLQSDFQALDTLGSLAKLYDAELDLVHIYDETDGNLQPEEAVARLWQFTRQASEYLDYERLSCEMLTAGNVEDRLLAFATSAQTDLLVMSSRQRGYLGRLLNTSLSVEVARQIEIPLLIFHHKKD